MRPVRLWQVEWTACSVSQSFAEGGRPGDERIVAVFSSKRMGC
jgi:hypothetical protein